MLIVAVLAFALSAVQFGLARMGFGTGVGGFVLGGVVMGGLGALLLAYEATGLGVLYRRLAREG